MAQFDTFIEGPGALKENEEILLTVRDLTPGTHKYNVRYVRCLVSSDPKAYPQELAIRYGRGQLAAQPYSIKIVEDVQRIPAKYL